MNITSYEDAGVNVEAGDKFASRIKALALRDAHGKMPKGAGGYAAVYPLTSEKWIALTTDGVGTKVLLAYQFNEHRIAGIDLVAMCANDLICVGARPTLFLDYYATGSLDLDIGTEVIKGIIEGCDDADMALVGGETAEMPDMYQAYHYDLAGFAVGELAPAHLITGEAIQPGQTVIGLASNGIHSNGLSLARKVFTTEADLRLLLEPTRIYVKPIIKLWEQFPQTVTGMAHITGGGWRNLLRLNPQVGFEISTPLPVHPVFEKMMAQGVSREECYKTFNMGMGLALIVRDQAEAIVQSLNAAGVPAQVVGTVTDRAGVVTVPQHQLELTSDKHRKG